MKSKFLKKKIIINLGILCALLLCIALVIWFYSSEQGSSDIKVDQIKNDTSKVKEEISELERKIEESQKYKSLWSKMDPKKQIILAIKVDDINKTMNNIADKYSIYNQSIKVSFPEDVENSVFKTTLLKILYSNVILTFTALNDVKAILFAEEFVKSLHGYPITTSFSITKTKEYTNNDFVDISQGKGGGAIEGKIEISWYVFKVEEKQSPQKVTQKPQ